MPDHFDKEFIRQNVEISVKIKEKSNVEGGARNEFAGR